VLRLLGGVEPLPLEKLGFGPRDLADALNRLVDDAGERVRMGTHGRARAEQFFDGVANARAVLECVRQAAAA